MEALRRSKFKFSGRQKIFVSKKFGFTKWGREEYAEMRADGRLKLDGVNCKLTFPPLIFHINYDVNCNLFN